MRQVSLSTLKSGITRLRDKGGASPDALFDLLNGYVDASGAPTSRGGTRLSITLPAGTKGLMPINGSFLVFSHVPTVIADPKYSCEVLVNPNDPDQPIKEIHFATPFLGYPYVVAEFDNGDVIHYWLQDGKPWQAGTFYHTGDIVEPTTPNGLAYRATRDGSALPSWAPNVPRAIGDTIEPTVYNDYLYTVVDVAGDNPASGAVEPTWPAADGAQVIEDTNGVGGVGTPLTPPPPTNQPGTGTVDRYAALPSYKQRQLGMLEP